MEAAERDPGGAAPGPDRVRPRVVRFEPVRGTPRVSGVGRGALLGAACLFLLHHLVVSVLLPALAPREQHLVNDFGSYYVASRLIARGETPYRSEDGHRMTAITGEEMVEWGIPRSEVTAYVYPPLLAVTLVPLTRLPYPAARLVWSALSVLWFLGSVCLTFLLLGRKPRPDFRTLLILAVLTASMPTKETLTLGQVNYLVLLLLLSSAWWARRGRSAWAGAALAIATLLKVTPAVLLLHFARRREWRVIVAFSITAVTMVAVLQLLAPRSDSVYAREVVPSMITKAPAPNDKSLSTWWKYLFTDNDRVDPVIRSPALARSCGALATVVLVGAFLLGLGRVPTEGGAGRDGGPVTEFMMWMVVSLLVQPYLEVHHLVLAGAPLAFLIDRGMRGRLGWRSVVWAGVAFGFLNSRGFDSFGKIGEHWSSVFLSNPQVYGLAILLLGLFAIRRPGAGLTSSREPPGHLGRIAASAG